MHQESCPNLRGYNREPDKYQPVQWDMEQLGEQEFRTSIVVEVVNHQGVLAQLANVIAATGANIHSISTEEKMRGVSGQLADHHQTSLFIWRISCAKFVSCRMCYASTAPPIRSAAKSHHNSNVHHR